jgi:hypothetical protein
MTNACAARQLAEEGAHLFEPEEGARVLVVWPPAADEQAEAWEKQRR